MKTRNDAPVSQKSGCVKQILTCSLALILVLSPCAFFLFAPLIYRVSEVQRFIDGVKQLTSFSTLAQKESDLIAFVCHHRRGYGSNLYTVHPDGKQLRLLRSSFSTIQYSLDWSRDGIWLAMNMKDEGYWDWNRHWGWELFGSEVYSIRFDGWVIRRLTYNRYDEHDPRWSKDGTSIFFDSGGLHSVSANGGEIKQINQLSRGSYSLSQNGLLLSIEHNRTGDPALDYSLHRDASGLTFLVKPEAPIAFNDPQQWSRNDEAFLYFDGYTGLAVFNMKTLLRVDVPRWGIGPGRLSPDGKWVAATSVRKDNPAYGEWIRINDDESPHDRSRRYLYLLDMDTGQLKAFIHYIKYVGTTWSPDSEWIAFVSSSNDGQLFKIRRDGTGLQQLTELDCHITEISWSPK